MVIKTQAMKPMEETEQEKQSQIINSHSQQGVTPSQETSEPVQQKRTGKGRRTKTKQLEEENAYLKTRIAELENRLIRLNAELLNMRKRYDREMERILIYSNEKLIEKILPLVDDLDRALQAADETKDFIGFRNGVEIIYKKLMKILEEEGVKPIKALGSRFDYNLHEAVMTQKKEGTEPGIVLQEVQKGFMYKDKVLRHAKVIVSE